MSRSKSQPSEPLPNARAATSSKTNKQPQPPKLPAKSIGPQLVTYTELNEGDRLFGLNDPDLIILVLRKIEGDINFRSAVELALESNESRMLTLYEDEFNIRNFYRLPPEPVKSAASRSYFSEAARRRISGEDQDQARDNKPDDDLKAIAPLTAAILPALSTREKRANRRASSNAAAYRK